jgi:hypothetical protein
MRGLRHIAAVWFAILIVSPLCCCANHAAPKVEEPAHTCCPQVDEKGQAPAHCPDCSCSVKNPRISDGGKSLVSNVDLPEIAQLLGFEVTPTIHASDLAPAFAPVSPYSRPPRLMLVVRQSFLI